MKTNYYLHNATTVSCAGRRVHCALVAVTAASAARTGGATDADDVGAGAGTRSAGTRSAGTNVDVDAAAADLNSIVEALWSRITKEKFNKLN